MPTSIKSLARRQSDLAIALLITAANCELVCGLKWRLVRAYARELGIPMLAVGSKAAISATQFMDALERAALVEPEPKRLEDLSDEEQREQMRQSLGMVRRAGGAS